MTEWTILSHRDILLVGAVVALLARPDGRQIHQGSAGHDANRELGLTGRTNAHPDKQIEKLFFFLFYLSTGGGSQNQSHW
jgi:hypothetical protein